MSRPISQTGTVEAVPSGYDSANSSYSSVSSSYPISNGYAGSDSTSYAYITCRTGSRAESHISYTFSVDIPSGATITSVTCQAKSRVSSTSYISTAVMQLYAGSSAKGSTTDYRSTSASVRSINGGSSWTVAEAESIELRLTATRGTSNTSRAAYIRFYGADLTIEYSINGTEYEVTVTNSTSATVTADQWTLHGDTATVRSDTLDGLVVKDNGTDVTSQFVQRQEKAESYSVESTGSYGFALNGNGYYESQNEGVNKSAAVCRVNFSVPVAATITFTFINYAEEGYDFGVFGNIDTALNDDYYPAGSSGASISDSSYRLACNTSTYNKSSTQTLSYSMNAGEHFIDVKFSKDDASYDNNDTLQFKVAITLDEPFTPGIYYVYEISNISADHEIVVAYTSTGPEMYVKLNGTWRQVSKAYRKVSGSWQEVALDQAFQSGVNYKME